MQKIIPVMMAAVIILLLPSVNAYAVDTSVKCIVVYRSGSYYYAEGLFADSPRLNGSSTSLTGFMSARTSNNDSASWGSNVSPEAALEGLLSHYPASTWIYNGYSSSRSYNNVYIYIGPAINGFGGTYEGTLDDYLNPPTPTPTPPPSWYQEMWDTLKEELGKPEFWLGEWFCDLIDNIYGDNEDDPTGPPKPPNSTHVTISNPTITPAPTPIPYTTIVIPKTDPVSGDTYYETNYYYTNPSGTPVITTSPPTNTPSQNGSGNGTDYSPIGGDPYLIPQLSWLTNAALTDGENNSLDGISSISDGMDSIDEIGSNYTEGMGAVQDATGTLPTSWLLLIGIAAAIPLIAGIISRFLS